MMYANGVAVRFDGHLGINHEKAVALHGTGMAIMGSSNWTDASNASQREHNYFTVKPWIFNWLTAQVERKWNNLSGYAETKPFVPLPPDHPVNVSPANGAIDMPVNGAALSWGAGYRAHKYDIYFGTDPNPPLLYVDLPLGPSQSSSDYRVFGLPALQPGTTYYWKVVSKTMANRTADGPIHSFRTEGLAAGANVAPTVTLTSPSTGTVPAGAPVSLAASANDSDGTVGKVDFFANGTLVGTDNSAPYATSWNNPTAGSYTLTAVATDNQFAAGTSTGVPLTVSASTATATLVRGPYLQQPTDHSMVVVWSTREAGAAEVRYGVSPGTARTSVPAISRLVPAAETGLAFDYYHYTATLAGLAAATSYAYQPIVSGAPVASEAAFKTAPRTGSGAISFVAFGDSGTGSPEQRQLGALMTQDTFDFAMHVGDIVYGNSGGTGAATYATYQSYLFDIYGWLASKAFVPVEGNHDSRPSNGNGKAYLDLFELPRNGAAPAFADHAERYYSFDYGPVHFVALDTEFTFLDPVRQAEQLRWLDTDLTSTTQPWTIVFLHRAPYSSGGEHGSSPDVRAAFGPLFERHGVDLVLAGHEHNYERTIPIRESSTTTDAFVPYVVTGGGGAPLYPSGTSSWTAFSAARYRYVKIAIDACTLTLATIGLDGEVFDSTSTAKCVPGNVSPTVAMTTPAAGAHFTAPATITVSATATDSDGSIAKVDFYAGTALIGTATTAPYSITWSGVPVGTYTLTAVATDNAAATTTSSGVTISVDAAGPPPATLPEGWSHADIGNTGAAGNASAVGATFSVTGAGADVWGTADALHYVYRTLEGDGTIVARVATIQNVHAWTKAGVMIRNSLSPSAAQAFMLVASSAVKGVPFQRRTSNGNSSVSTGGSQSTAPRWVKLVRAGNLITGYESANGTTWTTVGSDTFAMGTSVLIGLGVSSHVTGVNATATFDNVTVTASTTPPPPPPNVPPSVALNSPTAGSTFTAPAEIGLVASATDSDGTVNKVDFYAGATLLGTATTAPYAVTWSNVPAGNYTLTAIATDNATAATTSTAVAITVNASGPPPNASPTVSLTAPSSGEHFTAPASITVTANAADSDGSIARVDFYAGTTSIGSDTSAPYAIPWSNVPAGTYTVTAVATDNASATATSAAVSITVDPAGPPPATLPAGWSHADIGNTGAAGNASATGGTFTVTGAGADVWGTADALHYAYRTLAGDGTIVARVTTIQNVHAWTKAGVMIRNSLSPSAAQAFMLVASSAGKGVPFQRRTSDGNSSVGTGGSHSTAPRWVKLVRAGNLITGYESANGTTWTTVGTDTFAMGTTVLIGLGVSSHVTGVNATATFDNVTVTAATAPPPPPPNAPPSVSLNSPTAGTHFTAPADIGLVASAADSDGTINKVDFYAGATLIGTATTSPYSVTWNNVPAGTYVLTAVATDNAAASTTSSAVTVIVDPGPPPPPALPEGWNHADIGNTGAAGDSSAAGGTFTVTGAGADVWGTADALQYVYRTLEGDGTIVARVTTIQNVHAWTKTGVMIRHSLSPSAAQAFMLVASSPVKGVPFQRRTSDGNGSVSTSGSQSTAPRWVKLVRAGNVITGYESANGTTWTMVGSDTFTMGTTVLIGLGVSSHVTGVNATATFDNVTVTPATAPLPPGNQ